MDLTNYVPQLIRCLILMFTSEDQKTLQEAWNALLAVTKNLDPSDLMVYVSDVRQVCCQLLNDISISIQGNTNSTYATSKLRQNYTYFPK